MQEKELETETKAQVLIEGFGFTGYRSFGGNTQFIGPLSAINFFIGANNSGKSNILRFCANKLQTAYSERKFNTTGYERPRGSKVSPTIARCVRRSDKKFKRFQSKFLKERDSNVKLVVGKLFDSPHFMKDDEYCWLAFNNNKYVIDEFISDPEFEDLTTFHWSQAANFFKPNTYPETRVPIDSEENRLIQAQQVANFFVFDILDNASVNNVHLIPDIRKIVNEGATSNNNGEAIIGALKKLQNPQMDIDLTNYNKAKKKFESINEFTRTVIGSRDASIEIPDEKDTIYVRIGEKILPIENLGSGVAQVIILASVLVEIENSIVCIEEPESHLHPLMLKQLIRFIENNTSNQYFISTHSSTILNYPGSEVFHVRLNEDQYSVVERVRGKLEKADVCLSLGYLQSDLMMANYVVWVEGPSDRIYLNHWIAAINPGLTEGLHYSIMSYGGKLLSNFTAEVDDTINSEVNISIDANMTRDEFINLRSLNMYGSILMDRDKSSGKESINETKLRMVEEFKSNNGFAWVTDGREIENYIEQTTLEKALKKVHGAKKLANYGKYEKVLHYINQKDEVIEKGFKKKEIAQEVVSLPANLYVLDLKKQVTRLVEYIEKANGIKSSTES